MESFEYDGLWWLPHNCAVKWPGTLSFDHEKGITLKLIFETTDRREASFRAGQRVPVILGECQIVNVTVLNCLVVQSPTVGSSLAVVNLRGMTVLQGNHYSDEDQVQFAKFSVEFTYLTDWADWRLFQSKNDSDADSSILSSALEPRTIQCREYTVSFCPHVNLDRTGRDSKIRYRVSIDVAARCRPIKLQECLDLVHFQLRDFATLATGTANFPSLIDAFCQDNEQQPVSIYVEYPGYDYSNKRRWQAEMLFSMKDVDEHLDDYYSNWVDNYSKLASAYLQYFFPCHYLGTPDVAIQFIFLAQALESFHRDTFSDTEIDKKQTRLACRIQEVLCSLDNKLSDILSGLIGDKKEFGDTIRDTRNLLTHDPRDEHNSRKHALTSTYDRLLYIKKIKLLLEICFLDAMGLSPEKIHELIRRNRVFKRIAQSAAGK